MPIILGWRIGRCRRRPSISHKRVRHRVRKARLKNNVNFTIPISAVAKKLGLPPSKNHTVDHIIPLQFFRLTRESEFRLAFAPENHQWLDCGDNYKKGGNLPAQLPLTLRSHFEVAQANIFDDEFCRLRSWTETQIAIYRQQCLMVELHDSNEPC